MYVIVREGDGKFYTSMAFGYYKTSDPSDYKNRYWIVLNKEKTALIKQHVWQQNTKYLIPMVLVTDADESNWVKINESEESVDFLPTSQLLSLIESNTVPGELTQKCIAMDRSYPFETIRAINTQEDIRDLMWVSGGFHDAFISAIKEESDQLYILFDGTWGCKIEVWFSGEVTCETACKDPKKFDPYWYSSTVMIHDGFVYLIDEEDVAPENINPEYCWFRGRCMKYRVIPD